MNKEDVEESKNLPDIPQLPNAFAQISRIDEQMSLLSVAQRIGNPTIIEQTIKDEIATQSTDFLHTVGLKTLLKAISTLQPHISIQEARPYVQIEDLSITNTQTMVTKLLQTSHIVYNAQVRNFNVYIYNHKIFLFRCKYICFTRTFFEVQFHKQMKCNSNYVLDSAIYSWAFMK